MFGNEQAGAACPCHQSWRKQQYPCSLARVILVSREALKNKCATTISNLFKVKLFKTLCRKTILGDCKPVKGDCGLHIANIGCAFTQNT